jgi:hypothetical protein
MTKRDEQLAVIAELDLERVFTDKVTNFTDEEAANAWTIVDLISKLSKERCEALRAHLFERVPEIAEADGKGSFSVDLNGTTVKKTRRVSKLPTEAVVKECLKEKDLQQEDAFSAKTSWVLDPSKVDFLVEGGHIPADRIEASKKVNFALKVVPNRTLSGHLTRVKKRLGSGSK